MQSFPPDQRRISRWASSGAVLIVSIVPLLLVSFGWRVAAEPCYVRTESPSLVKRIAQGLMPMAHACQGAPNGGVGVGGGGVCPVAGLAPMNDPLAQQMEAGQQVIWQNTHADLQADFNALRAAIQASGPGRDAVVTSAYRPLQYQNHLWEIADRWCTKQLSNPSSANSLVCSELRTQVQAEKNQHFPTQNCPIVVASANACASHTRGIALDISLTNITATQANALAVGLNLNLRWPNITNDPYHWQLTRDLPACP